MYRIEVSEIYAKDFDDDILNIKIHYLLNKKLVLTLFDDKWRHI